MSRTFMVYFFSLFDNIRVFVYVNRKRKISIPNNGLRGILVTIRLQPASPGAGVSLGHDRNQGSRDTGNRENVKF